MISAVDLKAGMTILVEGKLIRVLEASHHKPGKGNTIMRMKLRDVRSGANFETSFRPDEKFERAYLETKDVKSRCDGQSLRYAWQSRFRRTLGVHAV